MRRIFVHILIACLQLPPVLIAGGWERLPDMPEGMAGMVTFTNQEGEVGYYGGTGWKENQKFFSAKGWCLHGDQWRSLPALDQPIALAPFAQLDGQLSALSGLSGTALRTNVLKWSMVSGMPEISNLDHGIAYAPGVFCKGNFYTICGSMNGSPLTPTAIIHRLVDNELQPVSRHPEGARVNAAACAWNGAIYIFGGGVLAGSGKLSNSDSGYAFNPLTGRWTELPPLPQAVRGAVALAIPRSGILLVGGYANQKESASFSNQVWLFDPVQLTWSRLLDLPLPLMLPGAQTTGEFLYVWGGEDAPHSRSKAAFRISLSELLEPVLQSAEQ